MAGLLDFLQAASNAAASNVSGPIDLLSLALNKAGVNVGASPVGGSEWLKQKGLMRDVPQSAASLAGETVGLLAPMGMAAKAPQIAAWRNAVNESLESGAGRMPFGSQRGAVVWHGSPHKFDKFDASKIGTGEGAQAYGHGLYLADSKKVADEYAGKLSKKNVSVNGFDDSDPVVSRVLEKLSRRANSTQYGGAASQAKQDLFAIASGQGEEAAVAKDMLSKLGGFGLPDVLDSGNLYKVDLPDEHIARMLDWDKPLFEQPSKIQELADLWGTTSVGTGDIFGNQFLKEAQARFGGAEGAADALRARGIPGVRYLDGGSRGAGTGTSNYVVFPGEEGLLSILERNGQGLLR